jgi:hypothetical protein
MTRDAVIRTAIFSLARWHRSEHGERCVCTEAEQFGAKAAVLVDALAPGGVRFEGTQDPIAGRWGLRRGSNVSEHLAPCLPVEPESRLSFSGGPKK